MHLGVRGQEGLDLIPGSEEPPVSRPSTAERHPPPPHTHTTLLENPKGEVE